MAPYLGTESGAIMMVLTTTVSVCEKVQKKLVQFTQPIDNTRWMKMMILYYLDDYGTT